MSRKKSLAKNSIFNIFYTLSSQIFPFITSIYVSRILLSSGVGKVSFAQNIASYFLTFSMLGLPTYGIREIAKIADDRERTNETFTQLITINAVSTSIASIIYIILILGVPDFRNELGLYMACGLSIFFNYINVDWFYQGKEEYGYITVRSIVIKTLAFLALVLFVHERSDYTIYAWIASLATGGNYIFNIIHARKYVRLSFKNFQIEQHMQPLIYLAIAIFFGSIYSKIDTTMLGIMSKDQNVGYYTYAHRIINAVVSGCNAITMVFLPRLSYEFVNNREKFNDYINFGLKVLSFLVFPMAIGLYLLAPELVILLFSQDFAPVAATIRVFCLIIFIRSFGDLLCYQTVLSTGNEKLRIIASALGAGVNVVLNYLLIPVFAQDGAAIASVISELIYNTYLFMKIRKLIRFNGNKKPILQAIIGTTMMAIVIAAIKHLPIASVTICISSILVGIVIYFTVNAVMHNSIFEMGVQKLKARKGHLRKKVENYVDQGGKLMPILGGTKERIRYAQSSLECIFNGRRRAGIKILERYHNIYKGGRCFLLGNGPSLTVEDINKIKDEVTFASNAIYKLFDETDWRPTYYAIFDEGVGNRSELIDAINQTPSDAQNHTFEMKFFREQGFWKYKHFSDPKCLVHTWWSRRFLDDPHFSEDLTKGLYTIATVTYAQMQIARWMGFDKIYLLGMDNRYAFSQLRDGTIIRNEGVKNYFGEDISNGPIPTSAPATWEMDVAYEYAEKYSREHGFRIYNATRGGYLEKFERVNLDDVLAGQKRPGRADE